VILRHEVLKEKLCYLYSKYFCLSWETATDTESYSIYRKWYKMYKL